MLLDEVTGIDERARRVHLRQSAPLPYDWLIIATGARHSYFGHDEWAGHAPGIKTIEDATDVRRKILIALERAETEKNPERRRALLTFVVIGGGPTGVEMAGAIAELAHRSVSREFRSITPHCSRIVLVDGAGRILSNFPPSLSQAAHRALEQIGVELRLGENVSAVTSDHVAVGETVIPTHTAIWAAGVKASPAAHWLRTEADRTGRVPVDRYLHPRGNRRIFVCGDTAACTDGKGGVLPGVAPVAKQQGRYAADAIVAVLAGRSLQPFRYRNYGNLATIGRRRAVIDFGRVHITGFPAWIIWCIAHVWFLAGFRNRIAVGLSLAWNYFTFARHARLITGDIFPEVRTASATFPPSSGERHVELAG
ncbi:FAD-dependent oxidoreductase [Sphingobium subterraneum]|uniref:NADH:ubiquinone reductase (non-electrogenic) n=1 Tax=Sphingobium subterraneum TaxID=627688 RepID=A0A841J9J4_9SPHN|nr:NADH dehydrogenase [Sphingobium subterraneum]